MSRWQGRPVQGSGMPSFRRPRVPTLLKILLALTAIASIGGALASHAGLPVAEYGLLVPELVWQGQIWRLATWPFFEFDAFPFLFALLMLYWFGGDLIDHWGNRRFLLFFGGTGIAVGVLTCLVGKIWPSAMLHPYFGAWPLADALTIAWALTFPAREIYLFFVAQVSGRRLVLITIGLTALYAIFRGLTGYIPHFIAELLTLLYLGEGRRVYLRWRMERLQKQGRRYLRAVEDEDKREDRRGPPAGKPPKWLN